MRKRSLLLGAAIMAGLPAAAMAQGAALQEVETAITHAGLAAKQDSAEKVHLHLHHVINCLVGEKDKAFSADAGNPCHGMGNGALNDAPKNSQMEHKLIRALGTAQSGLEQSDVKKAAVRAHAAESILQSIVKQEKEEKQAEQESQQERKQQMQHIKQQAEAAGG